MRRQGLEIKRLPKMTMVCEEDKCLFEIVHVRKQLRAVKTGYYIVPTPFATAAIRQPLVNRPFRSQKRAVDFCRAALKRFKRIIDRTHL